MSLATSLWQSPQSRLCAALSNFLWHLSQFSSSLACPWMTSPGISSLLACACMGSSANKRLATAMERRIVIMGRIRGLVGVNCVDVIDRAEHHHVNERDMENMPQRE